MRDSTSTHNPLPALTIATYPLRAWFTSPKICVRLPLHVDCASLVPIVALIASRHLPLLTLMNLYAPPLTNTARKSWFEPPVQVRISSMAPSLIDERGTLRHFELWSPMTSYNCPGTSTGAPPSKPASIEPRASTPASIEPPT